MNILIFILVLGLLIFVHELGHFLFAKLFGIRVDEFGFGYPPKMFKLFRWKGTDFTMNWIPFGGFVKIFGEQASEKELSEEEKKVSLEGQAKWKQILVMSGGVIFNILFAWILISSLYLFSSREVPVSFIPQYHFDHTKFVVTHVEKNFPAYEAGIRPGDEIKEYYSPREKVLLKDEGIRDFSNFIQRNAKTGDIGVIVYRDGKVKDIHIKPKWSEEGKKSIVGVSAVRVGEFSPNIFQAFYYGGIQTWEMLKDVSVGFWSLIRGKVALDTVSGPVGVVKQVGEAAHVGWHYLILFIAMLSINLAVLNFIPFPALDGGKIFFILIEMITRKKIPDNVIVWIHGIGFFILIALMILITYRDILNL